MKTIRHYILEIVNTLVMEISNKIDLAFNTY